MFLWSHFHRQEHLKGFPQYPPPSPLLSHPHPELSRWICIHFIRDVLNQRREGSNTNPNYLKDANYVWSKHRLVGAQLGQLFPKPEGEVVRHHLWKWVIGRVQRYTDSAGIPNSSRLKGMVPVMDFPFYLIELLWQYWWSWWRKIMLLFCCFPAEEN